MITIKTIFFCIQVMLIIAALFCLVKALYHTHQSERILNRRGKQTFWQWIKHVDTERGTGIWK